MVENSAQAHGGKGDWVQRAAGAPRSAPSGHSRGSVRDLASMPGDPRERASHQSHAESRECRRAESASRLAHRPAIKDPRMHAAGMDRSARTNCDHLIRSLTQVDLLRGGDHGRRQQQHKGCASLRARHRGFRALPLLQHTTAGGYQRSVMWIDRDTQRKEGERPAAASSGSGNLPGAYPPKGDDHGYPVGA